MSILYDCIFGPKLYRIFDIPRRNYEPYTVELYTNRVIYLLSYARTFATYSSPFFVYNIFLTASQTSVSAALNTTYMRLVTTMTLVYIVSSTLRGFSRSINPTYLEFIRTFKAASAVFTPDHKLDDNATVEARKKLRHRYDFEFKHWPVDFKWSDGKLARERPATLLSVAEAGDGPVLDGTVTNAVSWLMAHTIGRIMLYPGSIGLIKKVMENALVEGRRLLIENHNASRYKLLARDNNTIDCIFVDRRKKSPSTDPSPKGDTLVICSEGNAGFYEIGTLTAPLSCSYSVLGWNHPGFADSEGSPYPQNDINAFEAVINFAVTELGYKLEDIYVFAWSIGGFPAAWASFQYPEIKGVILDASFDDVLPLARARMMTLLLPIVDSTIRLYFNLNVSAYLSRYNGPVLLYRRLSDEVIPLDPNDPLRTNRGNFILIKLLKDRFPNLISHPEVMKNVEKFLHMENSSFLANYFEEEHCLTQLVSYIETNNVRTYPVNIGIDDVGLEDAKKLILFLAFKLMKNFNSTHCTPLPPSLFEEPFDLFAHTNCH